MRSPPSPDSPEDTGRRRDQTPNPSTRGQYGGAHHHDYHGLPHSDNAPSLAHVGRRLWRHVIPLEHPKFAHPLALVVWGSCQPSWPVPTSDYTFDIAHSRHQAHHIRRSCRSWPHPTILGRHDHPDPLRSLALCFFHQSGPEPVPEANWDRPAATDSNHTHFIDLCSCPLHPSASEPRFTHACPHPRTSSAAPRFRPGYRNCWTAGGTRQQ